MGFRPSFYVLLLLISGVLLLSLALYFHLNLREYWVSEKTSKTVPLQEKTERLVIEMGSSPISLLSYNIWFGLKETEERMKAFTEIVLQLNPHFIALQEVTEFNLQAMEKMPWFSLYNAYFSRQNYQGLYFVAIFVLKSHTVFNWKALPTFESSSMDRNLVWIESQIDVLFDVQETSKKWNFALGTAHLESLSTLRSSIKREQQLNDVLMKQLSSFTDVCFTGDTNIDDIDGDITLPGSWKDLWLESGKTDSQGYTWDGSINHYVNDSPQKARYDRVICKLKNFKLGEIRVVGNRPSIINGKKVFPSDHFGIFATFVPLAHPMEDTAEGPESVKFHRTSGPH